MIKQNNFQQCNISVVHPEITKKRYNMAHAEVQMAHEADTVNRSKLMDSLNNSTSCHLSVTGHFGPKTLCTLDTSALVWWVQTVQTLWHWCQSV